MLIVLTRVLSIIRGVYRLFRGVLIGYIELSINLFTLGVRRVDGVVEGVDGRVVNPDVSEEITERGREEGGGEEGGGGRRRRVNDVSARYTQPYQRAFAAHVTTPDTTTTLLPLHNLLTPINNPTCPYTLHLRVSSALSNISGFENIQVAKQMWQKMATHCTLLVAIATALEYLGGARYKRVNAHLSTQYVTTN